MAVNSPAAPQFLKGTVERAFYYQGKVLPKGSTCELPKVFALEMRAAGKFTVDNDQAPQPKAEKAEEPRGKKGAKDAG